MKKIETPEIVQGKRFSYFRKSKKLAQKEAAEFLGVPAYVLSNYETGRSEPSIVILKKMSALYQCSIDDLLDNENKESSYEEAHIYQEFIERVNSHPEEEREKIIDLATALAENYK
ncbi:MAG: helix-turn-helix domain-containing protein [Bacilli bacterium]|nr:helix-turn-helix domain-containing protein [Bacilli bacterium]